jgi:type IV pilus assembly protein PilE
MIVVAIVAILAAIAVPSYRSYVMHGNRNAVENVLLDMASAQERYMVDNRAYATTASQLGYSSTVGSNYTIALATSSGPPPTFSLTATPIASGPQAGDTACNAVTVNSAGQKTSSTNSSTCWQ